MINIVYLCIVFLSIGFACAFGQTLTHTSITTTQLNRYALGFSYFSNLSSTIDTNLNQDSNKQSLMVLNAGFNHLETTPRFSVSNINLDNLNDADIKPALLEAPLNYPNPFFQRIGTAIYYKLSKDLDIRILIYDMLAHKILDESFVAGSKGGQKGLNRLILDLDTFNGYVLSAGVYFYLIMHEGKVLGKGKMAVLP